MCVCACVCERVHALNIEMEDCVSVRVLFYMLI